MSYNYPELPTDFRAMTYRLDEARGQGELNRQLRNAGIVQQAWFARQGRQALHHVGHWLVTVAERVGRGNDQRLLPPTTLPTES